MLSAVVLTKDEGENIVECLNSLRFCDEIVVVDDNSSDATRSLAESLGAKVYVRDMNMDFSVQSNFGMERVNGEWILFVDADERIGSELAEEIKGVTELKGDVSGYYIKREDFMWGKRLKHGESGRQKILRLVRKGSGKWRRRVHPFFETNGKISELQNSIYHYPHPTAALFISSVNRWSTWHALANMEEGKKSTPVKICFWPLGHFAINYFLKLGFLDGTVGFVFALVMSFHSFLAWGKLWMLQKGHVKV